MRCPSMIRAHRDHNHHRPSFGYPQKLHSFLPVGLCVDESLPISVPRFSIPVWREAGLGLGLCVELVLPMPGAVGSPPTPFVDGVVSAARDKPLAPIKSTKATAAVRMLRSITLSSERISKKAVSPLEKQRTALEAVRSRLRLPIAGRRRSLRTNGPVGRYFGWNEKKPAAPVVTREAKERN
jgi:hypothetical protein